MLVPKILSEDRAYHEREAARLLLKAKQEGCVPAVMARLGEASLFFLLTRILRRPDMNRDWLFDRCREVQLDTQDVLDLWAREHYKSTVKTFGKNLWRIIKSKGEVTIGIFSHTKPIAKKFLEQIKNECEQNRLLPQLWPDIFWTDPAREAPKWSLDDGLIFKRKDNPKESTIAAHGVVKGQPIGMHYQVLDYDDVVTEETVTTPEQLAKTSHMLGLSFALGSEGGERSFTGTHYHAQDAYAVLAKRGAVRVRKFPATNTGKPDGDPVFRSRAWVDEKKLLMGPSNFALQMLLDPKGGDRMGFDEHALRYYDPNARKHFFQGWNLYLICDPASSKKIANDPDWTVQLVIGLAPDQNYYLVDGVRDRMNLTERARSYINLHRRWNVNGSLKASGYEEYGVQADREHIETVQNAQTYHFDIIPLGGRLSKYDRIKRLEPLFSAHRIYLPAHMPFVKVDGTHGDLVQDLIAEVIDWPVSTHDDILDCLARVLDEKLGAVHPVEMTYQEDSGLWTARNQGIADDSYDPYASLRGD